MLQVKNVYKTYKNGKISTEVLKDISFQIEEGGHAVLLGKSGSGKTTLLNLIGAMDSPTEGEILIDGETLSGNERKLSAYRRKYLGYIFQSYHLLPVLTAFENIAMPLQMNRKKPDKEEIVSLAEEIGIADKLGCYPASLSGGEKQRVAILRAMINRPKLILADEPTGNLDSETADAVMELLISLAKKRKQSILLVTHDKDIAGYIPRKLYLKDGRLLDREN